MQATFHHSPPVFIQFLPPGASERQINHNRSVARSHIGRLAHNRQRVSHSKSRKSAKYSARRRSARQSHTEGTSDASPGYSGSADHSTDECLLLSQPMQCAVGEPAKLACLSLSPRASFHNRTKWQEERSLQFFIMNTAREWAGWHDAEFWQRLGPQVSLTHDCLRHALVALGALHEGLYVKSFNTARSSELKKLSTLQSVKAATLFVDQNHVLPASVRLMLYVVLATISCHFSLPSIIQSMLLQHEFEEQLDLFSEGVSTCSKVPRDEQFLIQYYLKPILERQRSRDTQTFDMLWALRNAPSIDFQVQESIYIPEIWSTLSQARDVLEDVLKRITFEIKTGMRLSSTDTLQTDPHILAWMTTLARFTALETLSDKSKLMSRILRVTAQISMIGIMTMNIDNEMVFDQFTPIYRELADVFEAICDFERNDRSLKTTQKFGLESSLMSLCSTTVLRFCRCPRIRDDLIKAFYSSKKEEGKDDAHTWAQIFDLTRTIEERGIHPRPASCHDIPQENRRRLVSINFHASCCAINLKYLRYPYRNVDIEEYWTGHTPQPHFADVLSGDQSRKESSNSLPSAIYGLGYCSYQRAENSKEYFTISNPKFYFNIPRI